MGRSEPIRQAPGTLFVVATPIGHLEDITLRALRVLKTVQLVAAEDTRRTGNLLRHFQIATPILSVHEHNERARISKLIDRLARGESIALVTDAGTPGISDPGADLVAAARAAGLRVEPVPGPSAVIAAISASGIKSNGFSFRGFPPIRLKDRKLWLESAVRESSDRLVVFFEAPHRLLKTLGDLDNLVKRPIIVGRELTKIHEEFLTGTPGELCQLLTSPQGEFTLLIPPQSGEVAPGQPAEDKDIVALFGQITEIEPPSTKRAAARLVAERLGLTTKHVYQVLERTK